MARGFDDLHKVFIVQRSRSPPNHINQDQSSSDHRYSNHDRSSRSSSTDRVEGHTETVVLEHKARRYTDVCYGSPFKKVRKISNLSLLLQHDFKIILIKNVFKNIVEKGMLVNSIFSLCHIFQASEVYL